MSCAILGPSLSFSSLPFLRTVCRFGSWLRSVFVHASRIQVFFIFQETQRTLYVVWNYLLHFVSSPSVQMASLSLLSRSWWVQRRFGGPGNHLHCLHSKHWNFSLQFITFISTYLYMCTHFKVCDLEIYKSSCLDCWISQMSFFSSLSWTNQLPFVVLWLWIKNGSIAQGIPSCIVFGFKFSISTT